MITVLFAVYVLPGPLSPDTSMAAASRAVSSVPVSGSAVDRVSDDPPGSSAEPYQVGLAGSAVGQLLSPSSSCTATVIPSRSGQIALTAAHCVYVTAGALQHLDPPRLPGWIDELVFYPGRTGDQAPYGAWPVVRVWIDASYRDTADRAADVAFIQLAHRDDTTAQQTLGAQGIAFPDAGEAVGAAATALGYPTEAPFDGTLLRRCATPATTTIRLDPTTDPPGSVSDSGPGSVEDPLSGLVAMPCAMTEGSSGGPWLAGFDPATGTGTVTAVTTLRADTENLLVAAPLGPLAETLLDAADTTAPGTTGTGIGADGAGTGPGGRAPSGAAFTVQTGRRL